VLFTNLPQENNQWQATPTDYLKNNVQVMMTSCFRPVLAFGLLCDGKIQPKRRLESWQLVLYQHRATIPDLAALRHARPQQTVWSRELCKTCGQFSTWMVSLIFPAAMDNSWQLELPVEMHCQQSNEIILAFISLVQALEASVTWASPQSAFLGKCPPYLSRGRLLKYMYHNLHINFYRA
jgi:hypothetical protein